MKNEIKYTMMKSGGAKVFFGASAYLVVLFFYKNILKHFFWNHGQTATQKLNPKSHLSPNTRPAASVLTTAPAPPPAPGRAARGRAGARRGRGPHQGPMPWPKAIWSVTMADKL